MSECRLILGDCLEVMRDMEANSVDTVITDPPAGISFMGKDWDSDKGGRNAWIAWLTEVMVECLRVTKPGGMALVWSIPRTSHWTGTALEMAGWEVRDVITHLFGSGFPKSLDIGKAIDKHGGKEVGWFGPWLRQWRESAGISQKEIAALFPSKTGGLTGCVANWELGFNMPTPEQFNLICQTYGLPFDDLESAEREVVGQGYRIRRESTVQIAGCSNGEYPITAPATDAAKQWDGYGTALKPAAEFWWLAMKPPDGTYAHNALTHGVAGLAIDRARIPCNDKSEFPAGIISRTENNYGNGNGLYADRPRPADRNPSGRWPANLILTCLCERDDGIHDNPQCPCAILDAQSGERDSGGPARKPTGHYTVTNSNDNGLIYGKFPENGPPMNAYNDRGGASRFFYVAKASRSERNRGLEGMDGQQVDDHNLLASSFRTDPRSPNGGYENKPAPPQANTHPCVKPISLCRYLAKLTRTPTGGTVLDPFMGSGSIGIAALMEGRSFVGAEIDAVYFAIAERRIAAAQMQTSMELVTP